MELWHHPEEKARREQGNRCDWETPTQVSKPYRFRTNNDHPSSPFFKVTETKLWACTASRLHLLTPPKEEKHLIWLAGLGGSGQLSPPWLLLSMAYALAGWHSLSSVPRGSWKQPHLCRRKPGRLGHISDSEETPICSPRSKPLSLGP